ncbi:MAG: Asp-tRNA(Asn)/Glu-tRNA(Gln) amidotransferase subunit GatC [Desulfovibrionaceae bacterium]|nr:Asp-tRNA(Asn)/Glu-tRNA(Gln) amidotransferase subunit GatC [Desulfovibrionaceae bacterium]
MNNSKVIGLDEVAHMATLSRLQVSQDEQAMFATQFASILNYMDILQHVDVSGVEPLYSPVEHHLVPRSDDATQHRTREEMLNNAPVADEQYFIVPRIV